MTLYHTFVEAKKFEINDEIVKFEIYLNKQKCYIAKYTTSHGLSGGPLMLNGKGHSKLRRKIERDLVFQRRFGRDLKRRDGRDISQNL